MTNIITINNLDFKYHHKEIFNNLNLNIEEGSWSTIIGKNGSGKSTLVKLLVGLLNGNHIYINNILLNEESKKEVRKLIGVVFENPNNSFIAETVIDDIAFTLENLEWDKDEIDKRINEIANLLSIQDLLDKHPYELSGGQKQIVALASALAINPKILILDEALTMIDEDMRIKILDILKKINQERNITIINVTHDMEETIYSDNIIVIDDHKVVLNASKEEVYQNEKMLTNIGLELPFMVSMSLKLKYYGLLDNIIYDMNELVNVIWK